MDAFKKQREAKRTAQGLEGESKGAKASPTKASAPGEAPHMEVGSSAETHPTSTMLHKECVLKTLQEILE